MCNKSCGTLNVAILARTKNHSCNKTRLLGNLNSSLTRKVVVQTKTSVHACIFNQGGKLHAGLPLRWTIEIPATFGGHPSIQRAKNKKGLLKVSRILLSSTASFSPGQSSLHKAASLGEQGRNLCLGSLRAWAHA